MEISLLDLTGGHLLADHRIEINDQVFGREYNPALVHQVLEAYRATSRAGTQKQKGRTEVRGGGSKPWRQKGTGRARAGTSRSPLWRGGGVVFAARPRSYEQKVNRKMYRGAICSILSELVRQGKFFVTEQIQSDGKTKGLNGSLTQAGFTDGALIVVEEINPNLYLAARNLRYTDVLLSHEINPYDLVAFDKVLMTVPALRLIEGKLV